MSLSPYLMFNGNCEEAFNFYKDAFEGEIHYLSRFGESPTEVSEEAKNLIMHVSLEFFGGMIMGSDHVDQVDYTSKPVDSSIHLNLDFKDVTHQKKVFENLSKGGTVTMPLQAQFWGDQFGMLTDRFGIKWMFSCRTEPKEA